MHKCVVSPSTPCLSGILSLHGCGNAALTTETGLGQDLWAIKSCCLLPQPMKHLVSLLGWKTPSYCVGFSPNCLDSKKPYSSFSPKFIHAWFMTFCWCCPFTLNSTFSSFMLNLLTHGERTVLSPLYLHFLRLTSKALVAADSCKKATFALMVRIGILWASSSLSSSSLTPILGDKDCTVLHIMQSHQILYSDPLPTQSTYWCLWRPNIYVGLLQHARPLCLRNGILKGLIPFSMKSQPKFPLIAKVCVQDLISLVAQCQKWWTLLDMINHMPKLFMCLTESWREQELNADDGSKGPEMGPLLLPPLLWSRRKEHINIIK